MEVLSVVAFALLSWWAMSVGVRLGTLELERTARIVLNAFVIILFILAGTALVIGA